MSQSGKRTPTPRSRAKQPAAPPSPNALKNPQNRWQRTVRYVWNGKRGAR